MRKHTYLPLSRSLYTKLCLTCMSRNLYTKLNIISGLILSIALLLICTRVTHGLVCEHSFSVLRQHTWLAFCEVVLYKKREEKKDLNKCVSFPHLKCKSNTLSSVCRLHDYMKFNQNLTF